MTDERNGGLPVTASARIEIDGSARRFGTVEIVPLTVYYVPELRPGLPGPWTGEADKITWTDPATDMACIIRRSVDGYLCGFVAVEPEHPLYGYEADGLPNEHALTVHGGVSYAQACEHRRPIARSVWRRPPTPDAPPAWWFGFECNRISDDVPCRPSPMTGDEHAPSFWDHRDDNVPIPAIGVRPVSVADASVGQHSSARSPTGVLNPSPLRSPTRRRPMSNEPDQCRVIVTQGRGRYQRGLRPLASGCGGDDPAAGGVTSVTTSTPRAFAILSKMSTETETVARSMSLTKERFTPLSSARAS